MTQRECIPLLESELSLLGIAYDRSELLAWNACMRPCICPSIADYSDVGRLARVLMETIYSHYAQAGFAQPQHASEV
jgi:hypothetical protein